jgi:hypothetical protein
MKQDNKYNQLKAYLSLKYDYYASLGKYELGEREDSESEHKWRLISDIMEFIDGMEIREEINQNKVNTLKII